MCCCGDGNEPVGSVKCDESLIAVELLASQGGLPLVFVYKPVDKWRGNFG